MSTYFINREGPERLEIIKSLDLLSSYLQHQLVEERINCAKLKKFSIDVTRMSLSGEQTEPGTRSFFKPFDRSRLSSAWSRVEIDSEWPEWTGSLTKSYFGAAAVQDFTDVIGDEPFSEYKSFRCRDALDYGTPTFFSDVGSSENTVWICTSVLEHPNAAVPHIGGKLLQTAPIDSNVILRGELKSIMSLLILRFSSRRGVPHKYIPVILLSYARMKVRILQAYFENGRLKIQVTDAIEFGKQNQISELKSLLCWRLCYPVGNTQWGQRIKDPFYPKSSAK